VKFNERCFIRLLGDMRSYNFVFVLTPDFEGWQVRIRAMDFDQQSLQRAADVLLAPVLPGQSRAGPVLHQPARPPDGAPVPARGEDADSSSARWPRTTPGHPARRDGGRDTIAPQANVLTLRRGLAEHFQADVFLKCESMAALVRENLRQNPARGRAGPARGRRLLGRESLGRGR
jgi:hypothetical protein